ncbi:MAG: EAL domain-containing protein [Chloroflexi bacterium]|nr:EAL domain-containing protein [Chloroflexota bacterium]
MSKARVLIVEDESIIALDIRNSLEGLGYQVAGQADRGEDAIKKAGELRPNLILMDIKLKGEMDGIETAGQIRKLFDLPVIFLTAFADQSTLERARQAEPYGYILKPFEDYELAIAIEIGLYKHGMEKKLRESEERYDLAVRGANDGLWDWNLKNNEVYFSPRWKAMLGIKEGEFGNSPDEWINRIHPEDRDRFNENFLLHIKGNTPHFEHEYRIRHASGGYMWVLARGLAVCDMEGKAYRIAGSQTDLTARKMIEERLAFSALHDGLTGLPNRELFMDRLKQRIEIAKRHPESLFAVLFLDIDRFKVVNDSLGHAVGDQLLVGTARRLQLCLRPEDTVARLSGDEFAVLLNDIGDVSDTIRVAERFQAKMRETTVLVEVNRSSTASIGIVLYTNKYIQPQDMLRDADTAMYRAKALGGGRYQIFDATMHTQALSLLQLEADMKRAVKNEEWLVYYQPVVSVANGKISGVEALIRWNHPERGIISPLDFIPQAEDIGLIIPIGEFVLRTACLQAKAWREAGFPKLWVSVNLSGRQFQDQNLVAKISQILRETGLPSQGLRLEVTESVAMQDIQYGIKVLKDLNKLGVHVSLDDFGNGYSSLSYLKQFSLNVLKIDQSFIQDILVNKNSEAITMAIIAMARSLGLEVVAEGVEKEEQLAFLKSKYCDEVQGFLFSKPLPAKELTSFLNKPFTFTTRRNTP